ncbi:hypothetical protein JOD57_002132 [Geodermatophilus bullaregiensis]|nr:hypothetical protein [Geodermatophilus bullaregiensis]MBM7806295.1 hypothetical protein [Geodermatophilus bullaregiensis]
MEDTPREDRPTHDTPDERSEGPRAEQGAEAVVRLLANPRRTRRP